MAFGLVLDRTFNGGEMILRLAYMLGEAQAWTVQSSGKVASSLYGVNG